MKRIISVILALCLVLGMAAVPGFAAADSGAQATLKALGIMTGSTEGFVTRAQLAKMLSASSPFKDTVSEEGLGYSLYKDVKSDHWASEYIKLAVEQGWMTGYIDGSFKPDNTVTLEEACSAMLKLLGYTPSMLAGSFPYAQLNKAKSLGLRDMVTAGQGQPLSRSDAMNMFYNLLTAKTAQGMVYATTLGYTVVNGEVNYSMVVSDKMSGPYIAASGDSLPASVTTVYLNDKLSTAPVLNQYDVYYYNESMGTAWIYTDRVSGKINALSPGSSSPSVVVLNGVSYTIGSSAASYDLSSLSGTSVGDTVSLLLGMNGQAVGVVKGAEVNSVYYGVVQSCYNTASDADSAAVTSVLTMLCSDGSSRSFNLSSRASYSPGQLIKISVNSEGIKASSPSEKRLSGKVNSSATRIGDRSFASDVQIIDTTADGSGIIVRPAELAGSSITSSNVLYYLMDSDDNISTLILRDATGDCWTYGVLTSVMNNGYGTSASGVYTYVSGGRMGMEMTTDKTYAVKVGGVGLRYDGSGALKAMRNMSSVSISELDSESVNARGKSYKIADDVQVYLKRGDEYYLTELGSINTREYLVTGWYDDFGCSAGNKIRVIVAEAQ